MQNNNVKLLYIYNFYTSLAIMNCANVVFLDKFLLRANIDLSSFGAIKGIMYLLPAISYFLLAPYLQKKEIDKEISIYGYFLRVSIPCLLPLLALSTDNIKLLTIASIIILPISMMNATFANNSLMVIYRKAIPPENFNKYTNTMMMLLSMPANIVSVPIALFMDLFEASSNRTFFWAYFWILAICVIFEYPAIKAMKQVQLNVTNEVKKKATKIKDILIPYRDKAYAPIALITLLHGIICGSLGAYLVVYLILTLKWKMSIIIILISVIGLLGNVILPVGGKITDKHGFAKVFLIQSVFIFAATALFCSFWQNIFVLLIFWVISWDTCVSIVGSWMTSTEIGAGSKLASKGHENYYVSAYNICRSGGIFIGSFLAMWLYRFWEKIHGAENHSVIFHSYFKTLLIPIFLLVVITLVFFLKNQRKK